MTAALPLARIILARKRDAEMVALFRAEVLRHLGATVADVCRSRIARVQTRSLAIEVPRGLTSGLARAVAAQASAYFAELSPVARDWRVAVVLREESATITILASVEALPVVDDD